VCWVVSSSEQFEGRADRYLEEGALTGQKLFRVIARGHAVEAGGGSEVTLIDPMELAPTEDRVVAPEVLYATFRQIAARAREEGFSGVRVLADMRWVLAHPLIRSDLAAFELRLDEVVTELHATVVCLYRQGDHPARDLAETVAVHPLVGGQPPADRGLRIWNVDRGTWEVAGEIDESNVDAFERAMSAIMAAGPVRRLRCGGLRFISAAGIRVLTEIGMARPDQTLVIQNASPILRRCWATLELDEDLPQVGFEPAAGEEVAG